MNKTYQKSRTHLSTDSLYPLLLFILSFLVLFSLVSKGPYTADTLYLIIQSEKILSTFQIHYLQYPGYPLTAILGAVFLFIGKTLFKFTPSLSINLMSVIFSSLCISINFLIVKKLFDKNTAFFSSIILLSNPLFLAISVFGNSHTPCLFFVLASIYSLIKFNEQKNKAFIIISGIYIGLAAATRIQDVLIVLIALFFLFMIYINSISNKLKTFFIVTFTSIFTLLIFYCQFILRLIKDSKSIQYPNASNFFFADRFIGLFSPQMLYTLKNLTDCFTFLGITLIIIGFLFIVKNKPKISIFLFLWFSVPFIIYGLMDIILPRYMFICLAPLTISIGYSLSYLIQTLKKYKIIILLILIGLVSINLSNIIPALLIRNERALLLEFSEWLSDKTEPNSKIIAGDEKIFISYFGKRKILARPIFTKSFMNKDYNEFKIKLKHLLKNNIPVYITGTGLYSYNPNNSFSKSIKRDFNLLFVGRHLSEDWHQGVLNQKVGYEKLYKITLPR